MNEPENLHLGPDLAAVLELSTCPTRPDAAAALARLSELPRPESGASVLVLSEVVAKLQSDVVDDQDIVMDRAVAADTALGRGCISAGRVAVLEALAELGPLSLDDDVRGALHDIVVPALYKRGVIRLVSEPD